MSTAPSQVQRNSMALISYNSQEWDEIDRIARQIFTNEVVRALGVVGMVVGTALPYSGVTVITSLFLACYGHYYTECGEAAKLQNGGHDIAYQIARGVLAGEFVRLLGSGVTMAGLFCWGAVLISESPLAVYAVAIVVTGVFVSWFGQYQIEVNEVKKTIPIDPTVVEHPPGLRNEGNTCFINATFQAIMNDSELKRALLETFKKKQALEPTNPRYQTFIDAVAAYEAAAATHAKVGTKVVLNGLRQFMQNPIDNQQKDAAEFLNALLTCVEGKEYPELFFQMAIERTWEEHEEELTLENWDIHPYREHETRDRERMSEMSADRITRSPDGWHAIFNFGYGIAEEWDGQALLDREFQPNTCPGDPVSYRDGLYHQISETITLEPTAPQRIILALKRFDNSQGYPVKIKVPINMKEVMTIGEKEYQLNSIVYHFGGVSGGHYTAYIRREGRWWYANDSCVSEAKDISTGLNEGYVYFYQLRDLTQITPAV